MGLIELKCIVELYALKVMFRPWQADHRGMQGTYDLSQVFSSNRATV